MRCALVFGALAASFVLGGCQKNLSPSANNAAAAPEKENVIIASPDLFKSIFVKEWIERMDAPFLNLSAANLSDLCARKETSIELSSTLVCQTSLDFPKFSEFFETNCTSPTTLTLLLKPKINCTTSTLQTLRQKKASGPLVFRNEGLRPNTQNYPLMSQVVPIVPSSQKPPQLVLPNAETWIRSMSASGAVRVVLRSSKSSPRTLASVAKVLSEIENPGKFSAQIKFQGDSGTIPNLNATDFQISWIDTPSSDKIGLRVCNLVSGWIDYQFLKLTPSPNQIPVELQCALEMDPAFEFGKNPAHIEIGRLALPVVVAKTGAFLFSSLAEALSPSALLGLRLDL